VSEPRGIQSYADTLYSRGFAIDEYWDGMRLLVGNFAVPQIDAYSLDRVEVLKGPSSVLYGQTSPGGLANLVSKRPTEQPYHEVELTGGSYDHIQGGFDLSGPLDKDGDVLYRITGLGRDTGTQVNHTEEERFFISPALTWKPDDNTSITFLANLQRDPEGGYSGFLPADGTVFKNAQGKRFSQSFFDGSTDFNTFKRTQGSAAYLFEHRFNGDWTIRQDLRYVHTNVYYENAFSFGYTDPAETDLVLFGRRSRERLDAITTDNELEGRFSTGPIDHTLLLGLDYQHSLWRQHIGGDFVGTLNVADPDNNQDIDVPPYDTLTYQQQDQLGGYIQDQLSWDNWRLLLSGREDWARSRVTDKIADTTTRQNDFKFTGHAGLVYMFGNGLAPYASYSTGFQPNAGTDANGSAFNPTTSRQEEIGLKYQPKGMQSFVAVSAYNLVQQNVLTSDPDNPGFSIQTGEVRTRGIELEGKANLAEGLNITAAYSFMDNVVTKASADDGTKGKSPVFTPKHAASLWLDYAFGEGPVDGLELGGGLRFVGQTYGDAQNTFKVPSYTVFDASVSYDFGALSEKLEGAKLSLTATNLADKRYVAGCVNSLFCTYGEGRNVLATLSYRW
jgi:iron complex outermembrane receptor protein